jgi:carboxypeptidase C (cathepsin A)
MREYKMRRGEHLEDRIPDMKVTLEEYFGPATGTEEYNGSELYVIAEPENSVFERITAGVVEYSSKKDTLAVEFEERPTEELIAEGDMDGAENAVSAKNEFLQEATGRDAKSRRESLKRSVEDSDEPDAVS